jgi:hypothetical protein
MLIILPGGEKNKHKFLFMTIFAMTLTYAPSPALTYVIQTLPLLKQDYPAFYLSPSSIFLVEDVGARYSSDGNLYVLSFFRQMGLVSGILIAFF